MRLANITRLFYLFIFLLSSLHSQAFEDGALTEEDIYFVDGSYVSSYSRNIDSFDQYLSSVKASLTKQIAYDKDFNPTKSLTFIKIKLHTGEIIYFTKEEASELLRVVEFLKNKSKKDQLNGFENETSFKIKRVNSFLVQDSSSVETFNSKFSDSIVKLINPYNPQTGNLVCTLGYKVYFSKNNLGSRGYKLVWYINSSRLNKLERFEEMLNKCLNIFDDI